MAEMQQRVKFEKHIEWGHLVIDPESCIWKCSMRLSGGAAGGVPLPDCGPFVAEGPNKKTAERAAAEQAWAHLQSLGLVQLSQQEAAEAKSKPVWVSAASGRPSPDLLPPLCFCLFLIQDGWRDT